MDGSFPKPDEMNGRKRYWKAGTVNKWVSKNKTTIRAMQTRSERRAKAHKAAKRKAKKRG